MYIPTHSRHGIVKALQLVLQWLDFVNTAFPVARGVFLIQLRINVHDLIVHDGPEYLQCFHIQLILAMTLCFIQVFQFAKRDSEQSEISHVISKLQAETLTPAV